MPFVSTVGFGRTISECNYMIENFNRLLFLSFIKGMVLVGRKVLFLYLLQGNESLECMRR
jgi:hypothetical protein